MVKGKVSDILKKIAMVIGERVVARLIQEHVTRENVLQVLDGALDFLEELAAKTETTLDDRALKAIRDALNVPDGEE